VLHHGDTKDSEEEKPTSRRFILYHLRKTQDAPFPRSFAAFVHFVVSLAEESPV